MSITTGGAFLELRISQRKGLSTKGKWGGYQLPRLFFNLRKFHTRRRERCE